MRACMCMFLTFYQQLRSYDIFFYPVWCGPWFTGRVVYPPHLGGPNIAFYYSSMGESFQDYSGFEADFPQIVSLKMLN